MSFDITKFQNLGSLKSDQYKSLIERLKKKGRQTSCIEKAIEDAIKNIGEHKTRSFVIYGEPQSGKTEMMIALTARLVDEGKKIIVHLLNDSVSLLGQNLKRFEGSGIAPAPVNFKEIIDKSVKIDDRPFVVFCKKNTHDLSKLVEKLGARNGTIVIDDEADYASPNSEINKGKQSKINALICQLIGKDGIYIGVTATPARLDLNNTFENQHEKWVQFPPHNQYTGQEKFFPLQGEPAFELSEISNAAGDNPKYCREAFFSFLVNSAYLNLHPEINPGDLNGNYTFLIHTSGKKVDHKRDFEDIQKIFTVLGDKENKSFAKYLKQIWEIANERFAGEADKITEFIVGNILRNKTKILNSDADVLSKGTEPTCPFTVIIGGNIVSRGVTFDNLLAMFFTRDVKHKLQQDTYIQRARMFGSRGKYLRFFELTIPQQLYADWQKCFVFHRLALKSIEAGKGAPVWLSDSRIAAVAANSIDKANVALDSGEMSYATFEYSKNENKIGAVVNSGDKPLAKLKSLQKLLGDAAVPQYLTEFVETHSSDAKTKIMIHASHSIAGMRDADQKNISRRKGFMGGANFTNATDVAHHVRIHFNDKGVGRLSYKYVAGVVFLKNTKHQKVTAAL